KVAGLERLIEELKRCQACCLEGNSVGKAVALKIKEKTYKVVRFAYVDRYLESMRRI
ncbi:MAG: hypothetical protein IE916_09145, partial [Epsilonproteobacteria bacterium]|nr:hypothetical protein [Campylobacterota bacterium]